MKRFNMELDDEDSDEFEKARKLLGASSASETVRRSVRFVRRLLEHQGESGEITVKDKRKKRQSIIIIA